MSKLDTFIRRMHKLGIRVELVNNFPWVYIDKINGIRVMEKFQENHGFTLAYLPIKTNQELAFTDLNEVFRLIRKYIHETPRRMEIPANYTTPSLLKTRIMDKLNFPQLHVARFELEEYGIGEGMMPPPHPLLNGKNSFVLFVENCNITDVKILYRIIYDQLQIETDIIQRTEKEGKSDVHPLQYGVQEFLENILTEMNKIEGINDIADYIIKTR